MMRLEARGTTKKDRVALCMMGQERGIILDPSTSIYGVLTLKSGNAAPLDGLITNYNHGVEPRVIYQQGHESANEFPKCCDCPYNNTTLILEFWMLIPALPRMKLVVAPSSSGTDVFSRSISFQSQIAPTTSAVCPTIGLDANTYIRSTSYASAPLTLNTGIQFGYLPTLPHRETLVRSASRTQPAPVDPCHPANFPGPADPANVSSRRTYLTHTHTVIMLQLGKCHHPPCAVIPCVRV
ncbi:hypothetical protein V8B97DRAFT_1850 [Scleroderma yunnanense]